MSREITTKKSSMKTTIFSALILLILAQTSGNLSAKCNPIIKSNVNVIKNTQTVQGGNTPQWVCNGDTLISGGGIFLVYLETGAVMNTDGGVDSIYVKNGSTLNMSGGIHKIFAEPSAILNIAGGGATIINCPSISFTYNNAPSTGCLTTSVYSEVEKNVLVTIAPNPANGIFNIKMNVLENTQIKIYNIYAECVYQNISTSSNFQIDLSSQPNGLYTVQLTTNQGTINKKLVIAK